MACGFLAKHGYQIIDRNYHCQGGEVDIVAKKGDEYYFVEVKTRVSIVCGYPEEAFDTAKQYRVEEAALDYLAKKELEIDSWQLALVCVRVLKDNVVKCKLIIL